MGRRPRRAARRAYAALVLGSGRFSSAGGAGSTLPHQPNTYYAVAAVLSRSSFCPQPAGLHRISGPCPCARARARCGLLVYRLPGHRKRNIPASRGHALSCQEPVVGRVCVSCAHRNLPLFLPGKTLAILRVKMLSVLDFVAV